MMQRVVACVVTVLAAGLVASCGPSSNSDEPATTSSADTSTATGHTDVVAEFSTPVYELAYDESREAVWVAEITSAGIADQLWRVDTASGQTTTYPLPAADHNGYLSDVRVASDGAVWVSLPYELVRVDPATHTVDSLPLPLAAEDALPAATDSTADLPGTWISEIVVDGSSVVIARMNVPYLTRVDAGLNTSRGASLSEAYAGTAAMAWGPDRRLYVAPALDKTGPIIALREGAEPEPVADTRATRLIEDHGGVVALVDNQRAAVLPGVGRPTVGLPGSDDRGLWLRSNASGMIADYDPKAGQLIRRSPNGRVEVLQLEAITAVRAGGFDRESTPMTRPETVTDFVVADDGSVWVLRRGGSVLGRWAP